jgi:prepilin-type N-terminal cleavage/methylation domain-containing protein
MKKLQQKGFTLVELAIVLTIVGLLIGGILKGQQLIANAQVTAQIAQFKGVEAALITFNDSYQSLPGDMLLASTRLPANGCGGAVCTNGDGNGVMGTASTTGPASTAVGENLYFWEDLSAANLLAGISGTAASFGSGLPNGKFTGSGLVATTITGPASYGGGIWVTAATANTAGAVGNGLLQGAGLMTPNQAAQIDRKMDDGQSQSGSLVGGGFATNCTTFAGTGYNEGSGTKDCTVSYRAQN